METERQWYIMAPHVLYHFNCFTFQENEINVVYIFNLGGFTADTQTGLFSMSNPLLYSQTGK